MVNKKAITVLVAALCFVTEGRAAIDKTGDFDLDGEITRADLQLLVNYLLNSNLSSYNMKQYAGYTTIDLGLPSGTLWAECNTEASSPSESGGYYAWGETEQKDYYDWSTYRWGTSDSTLTKYCRYAERGTIDSLSKLQNTEDVARQKMGGRWRMPTFKETYELFEKCKWNLTTQDSVKGYTVTGPNGNAIFLPLSGYCEADSLINAGYNGLYWTSELYYNDDDVAYGLLALTYDHWWCIRSRYLGATVRACAAPLSSIFDVNGDGHVSIADVAKEIELLKEQ